MNFELTTLDNLCKQLIKQLLIIFFINTICIAQVSNKKEVITIALIDFLYVLKADSCTRQLERDVFIPAIDRALNLIGAKEFIFEIKRVETAYLSYFTRTSAEKYASVTNYDIAIWGHVTSLDNNMKDHNLLLMVLTNPHKYIPCIFYYELEIRNLRIRRWNNISCEIPETGIALIPSILCYKLCCFLNYTQFDLIDINTKIKQKLIPLVGNLPTKSILSWHPEQECDTIYNKYGSLILIFEDDSEFVLPLNYQLYTSIFNNLLIGNKYNRNILLSQDFFKIFAQKQYQKEDKDIKSGGNEIGLGGKGTGGGKGEGKGLGVGGGAGSGSKRTRKLFYEILNIHKFHLSVINFNLSGDTTYKNYFSHGIGIKIRYDYQISKNIDLSLETGYSTFRQQSAKGYFRVIPFSLGIIKDISIFEQSMIFLKLKFAVSSDLSFIKSDLLQEYNLNEDKIYSQYLVCLNPGIEVTKYWSTFEFGIRAEYSFSILPSSKISLPFIGENYNMFGIGIITGIRF